MVALRGGSSNHSSRFRRLADSMPTLLRRQMPLKITRTRQAQRRLTSEQVEQLVVEYQAGDSMQNLASKWRMHRTTVADHLRRAGVAVREGGIPAERLDEAIRLYGEGRSCQRLARLYGCNSETVRQALKRAGVSLRSPWERPHQA